MPVEQLEARRVPTSSHDRDDRATIAVFAAVSASVIAALYYLARSGFDNPAHPIVLTLGLSLFITAVPFVTWRVLSRGHYDEPEPWWRSQASLTLAALATTAIAGMLASATGLNLGVITGLIGYAAALVAIVTWIRRGPQWVNLLFLVGSGAFASWACGVAWSSRHKMPLFWETLQYHADVHHDPLYNVSLANSMRSYGVPSTGLDGVPYIPYHYGSAWLNSQWAYLAGTDVLTFYTLGPSVIVIPLFFSAVLLLAVEARRNWTAALPGMERPLKTDYAAWLFFLAVTIGLIPSMGLDALGIWNRHALISESYVIGVPVFMLVMGTAITYWRRKRSSLRAGDVVFLLAFAPLMLAVTGFLKISLMLLLLATALGLLLLGRLYRERWLAASAILCLATSALTYKLVSVPAQNQGLVPFAYIRFGGVSTAWWPYFILAHLFWSWVYIYLRLREEKLASVGAIRHAAMEGGITDVVVVAIVAVAGFVPGELIDIHGGSAVYFSDVQRWLALALLMASAWRWRVQLRDSREPAGPEGNRIGGIRLSRLWVAALLIPISITMILNTIRAPATALRANVALRRALYAEAGVAGPLPLASLADSGVLATGLGRSPNHSMIAALRDLDRTPPALKRRTLLFIPQSYSRFWRIWSEPERCSFVPMIAPAASGLALLDGMPPVDCDLTTQYGMTRYRRRTIPQLPADETPVALCAKAAAKGFSRVVVLDGSGPSDVAVNAIECPVRIAPVRLPGR